MAISVVMPALEMAQETGKLISWLKKEGDPVAKGEPLLEIETDKAVMEIESPGDGVLAGVKVQAGTEVPVGRTIAWIVSPGEIPPAEEVAATSGRKTTAAAAPSASANSSCDHSAGCQLSPSRFLPKRDGLRANAASILPMCADQAQAEKFSLPTFSPLPNPSQLHQSVEIDSGSPISRLMAERTTQSWTTVPHFFVVREVDAGALNKARQQLGARD